MQTNLSSSTPLSISELNRQVKHLLELSFARILVTGEISNFAAPNSGHWYFTLKDDQAQVRCAMFRNRNQLLRKRPVNGDKVVIQAKVTLYPGRGDYQLLVDSLEPAGLGDLHKAFEQMKAKLQNEGLFDPIHKKTLPPFPKHIALITSATGAAIRDMIFVFRKRCPMIHLTVLPVQVQGELAANEICDKIALANKIPNLDAIIVGRGGGSMEDLWSFNEEVVARAIFASHIPVVSAVGHETDFTISDLVADLRAPTPSAAAEILSPDQFDLLQKLDRLEAQLTHQVSQHIAWQQQKLKNLESRLRSPAQIIDDKVQHIRHLNSQLTLLLTQGIQQNQIRLRENCVRLAQLTPVEKIHQHQQQVSQLKHRLENAIESCLEKSNLSLSKMSAQLDSLSPLATLSRGFAAVTDTKGAVISSTTQINRDDVIQVHFKDGAVEATVNTTLPNAQILPP